MRATGLGIALGVFAIAMSLIPPVLRLEQNVGLAALFAARGPVQAPGDVALVSISADSAEALGMRSSDLDEWPRSLLAALVDRLAAAGARVIVLDVIFEHATTASEDARLASAIERAGRVVLLERLRTTTVELGTDSTTVPIDRRIRPIVPLRQAALTTAPFVLPTVPIRTSQFWTFGRAPGGQPNLPAVALQVHLAEAYPDFVSALCMHLDCSGLPRTVQELLADADVASVMRRIREAFESDAGLAERMRSATAQADVARLIDLYAAPADRYLNYYGRPGAIPTIPMHEVLADAEPDLRALEDKTVFVGFSERRQAEQQDAFYTVYSDSSGRNLSGVEIGATAFANLLADDTLTLPGRLAQLAVVIAFGLALGAATWPRRLSVATLGGVLVGLVYLGGVYLAFVGAGLWLPLFVPLAAQWPVWLVALLGLEYGDVQKQRARIESALGHYVPRHAVRRLAREATGAGRARELLDGVCLYTDAEQFTRVAESMSPEALAELLNAYYDVLCTTAERHGGLVADISGDSMVAIWAAGRNDAGLAKSACAAALAIADAIERFNAETAAGRLPTRIGLDAGSLLLGDIGSEHRREYRAVGELVTTAARLQALNRELETRVLVTEAVAASAEGLETRPLGWFRLPGKTAPTRVHELVGGPGAGGQQALLEPFADALECFERRAFATARERFEALAAAAPEDGPTRFYVGCARRFEAVPPKASWDGSVYVDVK